MRLPKVGRLSRGASMLLGFALAALLLPSVATAATSLVTIANATHSHKAGVTGASQLLVAKANPSSAVVVFGFTSCASGGIYKVPAGKALIITGVSFHNGGANPATYNDLDLYVGHASTPCSGAKFVAASLRTEQYGNEYQAYDPGIPVPAGSALGLTGFNETGSVHVYGYLVPASTVPSTALDGLPSAPPEGSATAPQG
jgi:hypothetical protein